MEAPKNIDKYIWAFMTVVSLAISAVILFVFAIVHYINRDSNNPFNAEWECVEYKKVFDRQECVYFQRK